MNIVWVIRLMLLIAMAAGAGVYSLQGGVPHFAAVAIITGLCIMVLGEVVNYFVHRVVREGISHESSKFCREKAEDLLQLVDRKKWNEVKNVLLDWKQETRG